MPVLFEKPPMPVKAVQPSEPQLSKLQIESPQPAVKLSRTRQYAKQASDFATEEEWLAYKETQDALDEAGMEASTELIVKTSHFIKDRRADRAGQSKRFGREFQQVDAMMKRKYGAGYLPDAKKQQRKE
jgi:hypothetical protein